MLLEVEKLRRANVAGLREKYREVFGEETRCRHREHLFPTAEIFQVVWF